MNGKRTRKYTCEGIFYKRCEVERVSEYVDGWKDEIYRERVLNIRRAQDIATHNLF